MGNNKGSKHYKKGVSGVSTIDYSPVSKEWKKSVHVFLDIERMEYLINNDLSLYEEYEIMDSKYNKEKKHGNESMP